MKDNYIIFNLFINLVQVTELYYSLIYLCFNIIERWTKSCILPFLKKGDLGITKNYRGITLNSIVAKVYNALLLNYIQPEIEKILRKNQTGFQRNQSTTSQILIKSLKEYVQKSWGNIVHRFLNCIWFYSKKQDETNITNIWSPQSKFYSYNKALQKHESNGLFTWWCHWLL